MDKGFTSIRVRHEDADAIRKIASDMDTTLANTIHNMVLDYIPSEHEAKLIETIDLRIARLERLIRMHITICQEILLKDADLAKLDTGNK